MRHYRYGRMENIIGDVWYQVQVKRCGMWFNDESFSSRSEMMDYIDQLKENGHIIFKMN